MNASAEKTILLVEDSPTLVRIYEEYVRQDGYRMLHAKTGPDAVEMLDQDMPSAIVMDLQTHDIDGLRIMEHAHRLYPALPVIIVTSGHSIDTAVEAMRRGAYDFIRKPFPASRLTMTLRKAFEHRALLNEVAELRRSVGQDSFHDLVGQSPSMQAIYRMIDCVAPGKAHVFIHGEHGTGKETAARAIHAASPRRNKGFVALNCAATPRDMMELTLFGHAQHALTDRMHGQEGALKMAHGGTLFLDEVCDMPLDVQAQMLRFLQTSEMTQVGANHEIPADVRIIAATTRDPREEIRKGRFREDLHCSLHIIPIDMPPLRDRNDDIVILANHFLMRSNVLENRNFIGFDPDVISLFRRYDWPGNVRQLQSVIRNIVVLHDGPVVTQPMMPKDLRRFIEETKETLPANQNALDLTLVDLEGFGTIKPLWIAEKDAILQALDFTSQNLAQAAKLLEISPSTLYRKLEMWRLEYRVAPKRGTGT